MSTTTNAAPLLKVTDLVKDYVARGFGRTTSVTHAVKGVSFTLEAGQTYALVGESGSGKTTTGRMICRLEDITSGSVELDGRDYTHDPERVLRQSLRGSVQMVFQDPFSALNPRKTIGAAIEETLRIRGLGSSREERRQLAVAALERVGFSRWHFDRYPHQFSGGQLQRVSVARTLAVRPRLIVLDESVSALDVSIQAQVLNLLQELKSEFSLSYLFITHDLSVVRFMADKVGVLRMGEMVEEGDVSQIFESPESEYTRLLLRSVPIPDPTRRQLV
ncbi:ATP-binding cassette domain-containing protein [Pseudoclavibacter sp. 13-3]|uniref:ATP-binding cassette domain-containing protein n=1 Tax=Pseudoclavibacter sp. 13-3 TaxID=2901228 RepID=UPI001E5DFBA3|nr:ATP-binding cassette domain-containing protein [Pseudoclavibacter sp. 13-3]MCD7101315.1 ATP-binding cassette domain-containing protein [Pseudoclavibacter sp. 13-3]